MVDRMTKLMFPVMSILCEEISDMEISTQIRD